MNGQLSLQKTLKHGAIFTSDRSLDPSSCGQEAILSPTPLGGGGLNLKIPLPGGYYSPFHPSRAHQDHHQHRDTSHLGK